MDEKIRKQQEKGNCERGHYFEEKDGCMNCGKSLLVALKGGNAL